METLRGHRKYYVHFPLRPSYKGWKLYRVSILARFVTTLRPSYKGWKLSNVGDNTADIQLCDLPIRDGNDVGNNPVPLR